MKRQRGRNRRSGGGGNNPNRHFESNGPDVKIRGSAQQVLEKYLQYARDAQTSGDRVMSEAYFQHAEHYQRLLAAMQPKDKPRRERDDRDGSADRDDEADDSAEGDEAVSADDEDARGDEKRPARQRTRKPRKPAPDEGEAEGGDTGDAPRDPLEVIDAKTSPEAGEDDAQSKPRRRRSTYRKRTGGDGDGDGEANGDGGVEADGLAKTLSRGRKPAATREDDGGATDAEPTAAE